MKPERTSVARCSHGGFGIATVDAGLQDYDQMNANAKLGEAGTGSASYRDGVASGWIYGQAVHDVHINELAHALERDDGVIVSAAKSGN
jgi:hypothetical protein